MADNLETARSHELQVGTMVGEYRVTHKLGEGGMGVVYAGVHPEIGKRVAIKVLAAHAAVYPDLIRRFKEEARAVNKIRHPNIIDIFSFNQLADGRQYFVMEYLDGESLTDRLQRGTMEFVELRRLLAQICSALEAAHEAGVVHRDLKPDNIWVATQRLTESRIKLLDFGIAKLNVVTNGRHTQVGVPMGTPLYMPPEQAMGRAIDRRADIYALGVVLYQIFAGVLPFLGATHHEVVLKHVTEPPLPPSRHRLISPNGMERIILACLEKDPNARPTTAAELGALIEAAFAAHEKQSAPGTAKATVPRLSAPVVAAPEAAPPEARAARRSDAGVGGTSLSGFAGDSVVSSAARAQRARRALHRRRGARRGRGRDRVLPARRRWSETARGSNRGGPSAGGASARRAPSFARRSRCPARRAGRRQGASIDGRARASAEGRGAGDPRQAGASQESERRSRRRRRQGRARVRPRLLLRLRRRKALQEGMHQMTKATILPQTRWAALALVCTMAPAIARAQTPHQSGDPTAQDCVSANDKAITAKHQGKLRAAREQYALCARASCPVKVRSLCEAQLGTLNTDIPTVVFTLRPKIERGPVRVTMDNELLTDRLEGRALSVDPGSHTFVFEAPGMNPVKRTFDIPQGGKDQQVIVDIGREALDTHAADTAFDSGQWSQALPLYLQLYRDAHDPGYLRRVAICRRHLVESGAENPESAIDTIQEYLDLGSISTDDREWARQYRDDMLALKNAKPAASARPPEAERPPATTAVASAAAAPTISSPAATLQATPSSTAPEPSSSGHKTLGIAALATGGAFLIGGAVAWKLSNDRYDSLKSACDRGCTQSERSDGISAVETRDRLTVGGFLIGGALVAAGIVALFLPSTGEAPAHASLSVSPADRGFLVRGEF